IRARPLAVLVTTALAVYSVVANGLAANLWPHFDLGAVDAPLAEVLLPLWRGDLRPWAAFATRPDFDLVAIVVASSTVAIAIAIARAVDARGRTLLALALGLAGGLALVRACE